MASIINSTQSTSAHKDEEDDEEIEALRQAALLSLQKKKSPNQAVSTPTVTFQPHIGNPNLIAIIPEGAERPKLGPKHPPRQTFFRHPPPRIQQFRSQNSNNSAIGTTLKTLPQVPIQDTKSALISAGGNQEEIKQNEKEQVSTKFSRFEDSESESEDESDHEKKESDSSDESEDVLALDDDDSLEALMAQMEHEIEAGIEPEINKKEKRKSKNIKPKDKEQRIKTDEKNLTDKIKSDTKTAIVEPTLKGEDCIKKEENQNLKETPAQDKSIVPVKPIKISNPPAMTNSLPPADQSSLRKSETPIHPIKSLPKQKSLSPSRSPKREKSPCERIVTRLRSPRRGSRSRSRTPMARTISPPRQISPRRLTPDRRSPVRRSPERYYSGRRSPSPYYSTRENDYRNRSRSPVRRRSLSPRRTVRELSPRPYQRRSRSPWSPNYRRSSGSPRYRSPIHRRSMSPRHKKSFKPGLSSQSPTYWESPTRRSTSVSPRRSRSPRKREYSPPRRRISPRREYRRSSVSPKRKQSPPPKKYSPPPKKYSPPPKKYSPPPKKYSPPPKKYSPQHSPNYKPRTPSPRRTTPPRRRISPLPENRSKTDQKSRTPSLSLSPSPPREPKIQPRRYKSPLRTRREPVDISSSRTSRPKRTLSPEKPVVDGKDKRKPPKGWDKDRDSRQWERKTEDRRKEKGDKVERNFRKERENRTEKEKVEEYKDEKTDIKVTVNPVFEARRKKFESTALVEPTSKKIRLVTKKSSPIREKSPVEDQVPIVEEKKIVENSVQTEDDLFSAHDEIDEIDNFLNEDDVLDLSAEVWSSDDELLPKGSKAKSKKPSVKEKSPPLKHQTVKEKSTVKEKGESMKIKTRDNLSPKEKRIVYSRSPGTPSSPVKKTRASPESEQEDMRDETDLRAELSRRREERLTKAGSLHEKLPARLLQSAFESALGKKKSKKEEKSHKSVKLSKSRDVSPPPKPRKEKIDGRRVLVLKRDSAPIRMQSAHINVTFPKRFFNKRSTNLTINRKQDEESDTESTYSSSSSDEPYTAPKQKLPVYMRLGTKQKQSTTGGRRVKLQSRRSQFPFLKSSIRIPLRMCTLVSDYYV